MHFRINLHQIIFQMLTIFAQSSILDVWHGFKYASVNLLLYFIDFIYCAEEL